MTRVCFNRNWYKTIAKGLGLVCAMPHLLVYVVLRPVLGGERAFIGASERIAKIPGQLGVYTRQAFYRRTLSGVGADVYFGFMSVLSKPKASIGEGVYIGRFCSIGWAQLGDGVMLADGVQVLSGRHQHGKESSQGGALRDNEQDFKQISIGAGAWLGAGCVVMADVGERAIVGAGAVVVGPVASEDKVGGVPAKPLKKTPKIHT